MSGQIPSELGKLTSVENLDIRKFMNCNIWHVFRLIWIESISICEGDYKVSGTIPTELGNMRSWKYVVFGKNHYLYFRSYK